MLLNDPQNRHLPGDPNSGVEGHLSRHDIADKRAQVGQELIRLYGETASDLVGPRGGDPTRGQIHLPDADLAVEEEAFSGCVSEGGPIGVLDEDEEVQGDVELDVEGYKGDTRRDAGDGHGGQGGGGVLGLEDRECEDEDDDEEEEEKSSRRGGAASPCTVAALDRRFRAEGRIVAALGGGHDERERGAMGNEGRVRVERSI